MYFDLTYLHNQYRPVNLERSERSTRFSLPVYEIMYPMNQLNKNLPVLRFFKFPKKFFSLVRTR